MATLYTKDPAEARKKGLDESFSAYLIWGGVYGGPILLNRFNIFIFAFSVGNLCYTSLNNLDKFGVFAENIHFALVLFNTLSSTLFCTINKKYFDILFTFIGSGFYDYGSSFDANSFNNLVDTMRLNVRIRKRKRCNQYIQVIVLAVIINSLGVPLFDWYTGKLQENIQKTFESEDGFVWALPVLVWFPFEPSSNLHFIGAIIYEYYITIFLTGMVICLDLPLMAFGEEMCNEFEILAQSLLLFDKRAKTLYKIRYGREPKRGKNDRRFEECIQDCLRDSIKHHLILIEYFNALQTIINIPLLVGIFVSSGVLCLTSVLFTDESLPMMVKINFFYMMLGESVYSFMFCWYGQMIQDSSILPLEAIYNSEWYQHSDVIKSYMLIIQSCSHPLKLTAGGFIVISLDTFTDIYRTAYSYFSLLQAFK